MSFARALLPAFAFATAVPAAVDAQVAGVVPTMGVASWYGGVHDGRRTTSGETFHEEGLTAASRVLPLGTRVRVTMADTGRSVVVKVNDRMGARTAVIDLSKGAARQIGLLGRGRGLVSIEQTDDEPVEVAEASEDEVADMPPVSHRARRLRRGARNTMVARSCCRGASVVLARHSAHRVVVRHRT